MVEGARLESVYAGDRLHGSNPCRSDIIPIFVENASNTLNGKVVLTLRRLDMFFVGFEDVCTTGFDDPIQHAFDLFLNLAELIAKNG